MKKNLQYILIFLFSLNFLIMVVGLDIYHHICVKTGKHIISFSKDTKCDNHHFVVNNTNECYSCCSHFNSNCQHKPKQHSHSEEVYDLCCSEIPTSGLLSILANSCKTFYTHVKITGDYISQESLKLLNFSKVIHTFKFAFLNSINEIHNKPKFNVIHIPHFLPTKELINFIHIITTLSSDKEPSDNL